MIEVLNEIKIEDAQAFEYLDEKIASNIYFCSFSIAMKSVDNSPDDTERTKKNEKNKWLLSETENVKNVPVLSFDNIIRKLNNDMKSCDAFFYCFDFTEGDRHFLVEFKNAGKKEAVEFLKIFGKDSIYEKINDSIKAIKSELKFGGNREKEDIVEHTHFIYVYSGKNDVASTPSIPFRFPRKQDVTHDRNGKQNKAARSNSHKEVEGIYSDFEKKLEKLGLESCSEDILPGKAIPRVRKRGKGSGKVRQFSMFSSSDFAELIDSDYFVEWKWGDYKSYFK